MNNKSNDRESVRPLIQSLATGRQFYAPEEIKTAKRKLPLTHLMVKIGDGAFISEKSVESPFHPSERPFFKLHYTRRGLRFACCGKCGYQGDQIDYLKARFDLTTGEAIA